MRQNCNAIIQWSLKIRKVKKTIQGHTVSGRNKNLAWPICNDLELHLT